MNNKSRVLKWSLVFGIVIVLNMFFGYALSLVYHEPVYNNYCPVSLYDQGIQNTAAQNACSNAYTAAQSMYDRNVFITLILLGAIMVAIGNFLKGNALISQALSLSGVLSFIIASMRYWSDANDIFKVIILATALFILIWIAYKKFKD